MKIQNSFPLKQSPETKAAGQEAHLREAAKMYENHFLGEMVKAMRSTVHREDGLMAPNMAEKIFGEQLDQQYVDGWANKGGVGLADMIYNQIHDRYLATTKKDFSKAPSALPISPKSDAQGVKSLDSIKMKSIPAGEGAKMQFRFEIPDPSGGGFEAVSPMPGVVIEARALGQGWQLVNMDHGQGVRSEMTFPGSLTDLSPGAEVKAGQKLGILDPSSAVLAWKLDWT